MTTVDPPKPSLAEEILTLSELQNVPKPQPLLPGRLNLNSLAWIAGPPGSYKTFLALDYALKVAEHHPILYVAGEGLSGLYQRVEAWEHANHKSVVNTWWLPRAVPVTHTDWYALCDAARAIGAKLVVLDTQARMSGNLDENSAPEMGQYINGCEALKRATGGCVLSNHHSSKNGSHLRGSTVVQGAADTIFTIEVRDGTVGVHNLKQKDMKQYPDEWYRPVDTLESCVLVPCEKPEHWDAPQRTTRYANNKKDD